MVAVDTSTWIAYVGGQRGADVQRLDAILVAGTANLPLIVLTEILADPALPTEQRRVVLGLPTMEITDGFWTRAAATRAAVLAKGLRAQLADTLIAQSCIDHDLDLDHARPGFSPFRQALRTAPRLDASTRPATGALETNRLSSSAERSESEDPGSDLAVYLGSRVVAPLRPRMTPRVHVPLSRPLGIH